MGTEIERKFLVKGEFRPYVVKAMRITQAYISSVAERTVRIRICDQKAYLTVKGKSNKAGMSRLEWEKEIDIEDAKDLLRICEEGVIDKTRYVVPESCGLKFEVDEFYGENEGLLVAEIELPSEDLPFDKPIWLGDEVTGDFRYFNSNLKNNPYKYW